MIVCPLFPGERPLNGPDASLADRIYTLLLEAAQRHAQGDPAWHRVAA